jgi:hypothetical protein
MPQRKEKYMNRKNLCVGLEAQIHLILWETNT